MYILCNKNNIIIKSILILVWHSSDYCEHIGRKSVDERYINTPISPLCFSCKLEINKIKLSMYTHKYIDIHLCVFLELHRYFIILVFSAYYIYKL